MGRSKHGGWRVHESKPPTMPDNPSYPKKVLITSVALCALAVFRTLAGRRGLMTTTISASRFQIYVRIRITAFSRLEELL